MFDVRVFDHDGTQVYGEPLSDLPKMNFGTVRCPQCLEDFDLSDTDRNDEWYNGHDCEPV